MLKMAGEGVFVENTRLKHAGLMNDFREITVLYPDADVAFKNPPAVPE